MRPSFRFALTYLAAFAILTSASNAVAGDTPAPLPQAPATEEVVEPEAPPPKAVRSRPRLLPTIAAVVPGIAVHGMGHFVAGDRKTALRLLSWQGIGLGIMVASGATLGLTGASRYGNEVTIPALITGTGIFLTTAMADIYGSATGGRSLGFSPRPDASVVASYGYIDDPQFDYGHMSVLRGRFRKEALSIEPELWVAIDADNQRARVPVQYRLLGSQSGSFLAAEAAATYHRYGDDGFASSIAELSAVGRLDAKSFGSSLSGSYATLSLGYALHRTSYDVPGASADTIGLLLTRFGYGLYLPKGGTIEGYYGHRRDGYSAGLSPSSRNGSGFLGHFGLTLRQPIAERLALVASTEIGAAWVSTLGLEFRAPGAGRPKALWQF